MGKETLIELPPPINEPFEVFINGVAQERGRDFELRGRMLVFPRPLDRARKLGFVRRLFLVVAGTYRKHEAVDVVYEIDGRRTVATGLELRHY